MTDALQAARERLRDYVLAVAWTTGPILGPHDGQFALLETVDGQLRRLLDEVVQAARREPTPF